MLGIVNNWHDVVRCVFARFRWFTQSDISTQPKLLKCHRNGCHEAEQLKTCDTTTMDKVVNIQSAKSPVRSGMCSMRSWYFIGCYWHWTRFYFNRTSLARIQKKMENRLNEMKNENQCNNNDGKMITRKIAMEEKIGIARERIQFVRNVKLRRKWENNNHFDVNYRFISDFEEIVWNDGGVLLLLLYIVRRSYHATIY